MEIQFAGNDDAKPKLQPKNQPKSRIIIALSIAMIRQFTYDSR